MTEILIQFNYQKTYEGFSVACFILHSNLSVEPSSMWMSVDAEISAIASGENEIRRIMIMKNFKHGNAFEFNLKN